MSGDFPAVCGPYHDRLLRVAVGELDPAQQPELQQHLAECLRCRSLLAESAALTAALRSELAPAPLPLNFARRALQRSTAVLPRPALSPGWRAAFALLAACILVVMLNLPSAAPQRDRAALSGAERADLLASLALLEWDDPLETALGALSARLDTVESSMFAEDSALLDDWDIPAGDRGAREGTGKLRIWTRTDVVHERLS